MGNAGWLKYVRCSSRVRVCVIFYFLHMSLGGPDDFLDQPCVRRALDVVGVRVFAWH